MEEKWDKAKGHTKEQAGRASGDESLERQGQRDQAKGKVKEAWDKTKEAADKARR